MSTVSKEIADRIVAGEFADDDPVRIVKYTNAWGGEAYGVEFGRRQLGKYRESEFVKNPVVYWTADGSLKTDEDILAELCAGRDAWLKAKP